MGSRFDDTLRELFGEAREAEPTDEELDTVLQRTARTAPAKKRPPRKRRRALAAVAMALLVVPAAVAGADVLLFSEDKKKIEPAPRGDLPQGEAPVPGSQSLEPIRVPDPHGGPPWGMRIFRGESGELCRTVGRVVDGKLVLLTGPRTYRELPLRGPGVCSDLSKTPATFSLRQDRTVQDGKPRSVLSGLAREDVRTITVTGRGERRTLTPSPRGGYLTVYDSFVDANDLTIIATLNSGRTTDLSSVSR